MDPKDEDNIAHQHRSQEILKNASDKQTPQLTSICVNKEEEKVKEYKHAEVIEIFEKVDLLYKNTQVEELKREEVSQKDIEDIKRCQEIQNIRDEHQNKLYEGKIFYINI